MTRRIIVLLWALFLGVAAHAADTPWSGNWQLSWRDGSTLANLQQDGDSVSGTLEDGLGTLTGKVTGDRLDAGIAHDGRTERFIATLSPDGQSFAGQADDGAWLNGLRLSGGAAGAAPLPVDLSTPQAAMRSFLMAGSRARDSRSQAMSWAVETIDFGSDPAYDAREARYAAAGDLFSLVDGATFSLGIVPEDWSSARLPLSLPRLGSTSAVEVEMVKGADGNWRIAMPAPDTLRKELGGAAPPVDGFRDLKSPRDTIRAFLDGMAHWNGSGKAQAIGTIDLSQVPDVLRSHEGELVSQYLVRIIDRIGSGTLQDVPNSGAEREPFVFYENAAGRIVIAPVGTGADTRWKFTADTADGIGKLYRAVERLPDRHSLDGDSIPVSPLFAMRAQVKRSAPALLGEVTPKGRVEYWQVLFMLTGLAAMVAGALLLRRALRWLFLRPALKHHVRNPTRLATALGVGLALLAGAQVLPTFGLPAATRQFTVPMVGSLLVLILTYAAWQLIAFVLSVLETYAERTETSLDNILLTFSAGLAKLVVVAAAALALGKIWSLPATGLLAGLGVSGLAVAFASKETVANVFGAGILLGDRPFGKGDRIIAGDVNGWVEAVGLRSTRIRTLYDSLLIVPNGKLADMTVNNLGARRRRTFSTSLLVTSGGTPERLEAFTRAIVERIGSDPMFIDSATEANVTGISPQGIQIEISTSLNTTSGRLSREATHRLLLDILHLAQAQGLRLGRGAMQQLEKDLAGA